MSESIIQKKIVDHIEQVYSGTVTNVVSSSKRGTSDLICCIRGKYVAIEVKEDSKVYGATRLQTNHLAKVSASGGIAFTAETTDEVDFNLLLNGIVVMTPAKAKEWSDLREYYHSDAVKLGFSISYFYNMSDAGKVILINAKGRTLYDKYKNTESDYLDLMNFVDSVVVLIQADRGATYKYIDKQLKLHYPTILGGYQDLCDMFRKSYRGIGAEDVRGYNVRNYIKLQRVVKAIRLIEPEIDELIERMYDE